MRISIVLLVLGCFLSNDTISASNSGSPKSKRVRLGKDGEFEKVYEFKDVIYIWISRSDKFDSNKFEYAIFNTLETPMLQRAIYQSGQSNVHIVHHALGDKKDEINANIRKLKEEVKSAGLEIQIHDFSSVATSQELEYVSNFERYFEFAVDFAKMVVAANLDQLGLSRALILDFDVILPHVKSVKVNTGNQSFILQIVV